MTSTDYIFNFGHSWCCLYETANVVCDFICPMNYTDSALRFKVLSLQQLMWAGGVPCYPGIGISVWLPPCNRATLVSQVDVLKEIGSPGFLLFQYDRELYTRYFVE